jgi:hypothetical protein
MSLKIEKLPEETNWEFCQRVAAAKDPKKLVTELLRYIHTHRKRADKNVPLWSFVGEATNHGSGVSCAIVDLYFPEAQI